MAIAERYGTSPGELHHRLSTLLSFNAVSRVSLQPHAECTGVHFPGSVYNWARDQCSQKATSLISIFPGGLSRVSAWSTRRVHRPSTGATPGSAARQPVKISLPWECFCVIASSGIFTTSETSVTGYG